MNDITHLLRAIQEGDAQASHELLARVYAELRLGGGSDGFENRAHFFGAAAEAMRRILVDAARRKRAARRGSGQARLDVNDLEIAAPTSDDELLAMHEALDRLATHDAQKADLVKLRYFASLSIEEAATALGISGPRSVTGPTPVRGSSTRYAGSERQ